MAATACKDIGGAGHVGCRTWSATAAPTAQNDLSLGHLPGDIWVDTATPAVHICISNASGAAVWKTFTIT
jgi:hypothetical protein